MPIGNIPVDDDIPDETLKQQPYIPLNAFAPVCASVLKRTQISGPAFPAVDAHTHFGRLCLGDAYESLYDTGAMVRRLRELGIVKVINLDAEFGPAFDRMRRKLEGYEEFFVNFGSVDIKRFEEPTFEQEVYATLRFLKSNAVYGLKVWKNVGLGIKDRQGKYLRLDDARLDCIWKYAAEFDFPITIHVADPPQFFSPIDEHNERYEELREHPEWAFTKPGQPSFLELMDMFETVLRKNPRTTFIGAHMIYPEDLSHVAGWLRAYPNFYVDFADRLNEIGRHPYSTREFFETFQDRILFATDTFWPNLDLHEIYYRFLETFDEYFDYNREPGSKGRWSIYGIGLSSEVLEKIYRKNVTRLLPAAFS